MSTDRAAQRRALARAHGVDAVARREPELALRPLARLAGFPSLTALLRHLSRHNGRSYRATGLTIWQADRAAVACGFHPANVWGESWWRAVARHEARYSGECPTRREHSPAWSSDAAEVEQLERDVDELEAAIRAELERPL